MTSIRLSFNWSYLKEKRSYDLSRLEELNLLIRNILEQTFESVFLPLIVHPPSQQVDQVDMIFYVLPRSIY
jgi:hypothetical protein